MLDYREKLWKYVENGGVCYWAYQYAWGWKPGDTSGPGYFPRTLMVGEGTSVLWGEGIELHRPVTMDDDPIWNSPNRITPEDWLGWQVGPPDTMKLLHYNEKPNTDRARNIPVYYSDHWKVHASAERTYNINVPRTRSRFGPYRWIKVHHKPSDDFFAVLRPWKDGPAGNKPEAEILKGTENEAFISQDDYHWRILLGNYSGINANLTVIKYDKKQLKLSDIRRIKENNGKDISTDAAPSEIMLADAKNAVIGGLSYTFEYPATFHFNFVKSTGRLSMLEGGKVTLPWKLDKVVIAARTIRHRNTGSSTSFNLPAGEYAIERKSNNLELIRTCHIGRVKVVDSEGNSVKWIHIIRKLPGRGRTLFQGATDSQGQLTMRWEGNEKQEITLTAGKKKISRTIKPGTQTIVVE